VSERNQKKTSIDVNIYTLDNYLNKHPLPNLKAIKIDVEGSEKEILMGAYNTLSINQD
jgi:FkbM family methyltransferase